MHSRGLSERGKRIDVVHHRGLQQPATVLAEDEALLLLGFEQALPEAGFGVKRSRSDGRRRCLSPLFRNASAGRRSSLGPTRAAVASVENLTKLRTDQKETLYKCRVAYVQIVRCIMHLRICPARWGSASLHECKGAFHADLRQPYTFFESFDHSCWREL